MPPAGPVYAAPGVTVLQRRTRSAHLPFASGTIETIMELQLAIPRLVAKLRTRMVLAGGAAVALVAVSAGAATPPAHMLASRGVERAAASPQGYWLVASDGGIFPFGAAG